MNGNLPFKAIGDVCKRRDPRWPKWKISRFTKTSKDPRLRADKRRYRRTTRREKICLQALDLSAPLASEPTPKSRRIARWIYRRLLPILYRRLFDPTDRFVWDAIEHKYWQYCNYSSWVLGRKPIDRLANCYPWRVDRLTAMDSLKPGDLQSSIEP
jgi:hypothetical protein